MKYDRFRIVTKTRRTVSERRLVLHQRAGESKLALLCCLIKVDVGTPSGGEREAVLWLLDRHKQVHHRSRQAQCTLLGHSLGAVGVGFSD